MKEAIKKILEEAVKTLKGREKWADFELSEVEVDYPKNAAFGDYTTNVAMVLGKILKKSPLETAEKINRQLATEDLRQFEKIEVVKPGYINFYLAKKYLQDKVGEINELEEKYGSLANKEKTMVEYSQPNTHKEFHIGHLRNVIIGSALVNVFRKSGRDVIAANYIGDTGSHVAKCLWALEKFHAGKNLDALENKAEFLGKVYSEATREIEENKEYEKEFKEVQNKFENGDENLVGLWQKTRQWSLDEFGKIYAKLGVKFDVYFYESEEEIEGKKMLPELLKTNIIKKSDGAVIADLEKFNLGILVLMRSDGAALYGLKDIPLAIKKFRDYKIKRSIYVVDIRQSLYFSQLFKILSEMGFDEAMAHIGYDFVTLKGGEGMSSRKGNIVPAEFLLEQVKNRVKEKFPESPDPEGISLGAVKFFMLKYSSKSKIEFDIDESVKLEGATGPYVQYAHARIASILKKHGTWNVEPGTKDQRADLSLLTHEKELGLIRELAKFPELVAEIAETCDVHKLPYFAIRLADKFHSFYNELTVLDGENPALSSARLELVKSVKIVLKETLQLIGVDAPERM